MIPFTPRLILAILPNLAHDVAMIQSAAIRTNQALMSVIQSLPSPTDLPTARQGTDKSSIASVAIPASPTPAPPSLAPSRQTTGTGKDTGPSRDMSSPESLPELPPQPPASGLTTQMKARSATVSSETPPRTAFSTSDTAPAQPQNSRPESPISTVSVLQVQQSPESSMLQEKDQIDYPSTVNALTIQFLSEHEETRVAALKWLIMLHQKAPKKILAMDDGTFPALLKMLSDSSEEVGVACCSAVKHISQRKTGHQARLAVACADLFGLRRGLLQAIHEQPSGALQHRQRVARLSR